MQNMLDWLKLKMPQNEVPKRGETLARACNKMKENIKLFINERILGAIELMSENGVELIRENEVILTYKNFYAIRYVFIKAKQSGKNFKVVVIDDKKDGDGREMASSLIKEGVDVTYAHLNGLPYAL